MIEVGEVIAQNLRPRHTHIKCALGLGIEAIMYLFYVQETSAHSV